MLVETISSIFSTLNNVIYFIPKHHNKEFLKESVERIIEKMGEIHKDYSKSFNEFFIIVRDKKIPPSELIDLVEQRSIEYEHARDLIKEIAYDLYVGPNDSKKLKDRINKFLNRKFNARRDEFVRSVILYFNGGSRIDISGGASWYSSFIETLKRYSQQNRNPWDTADQFDEWHPYILKQLNETTKVSLPTAWKRLSVAYVKLRKYYY